MKPLGIRFCRALALLCCLLVVPCQLWASDRPVFILAHTPKHQDFAAKLQQNLQSELGAISLQRQPMPLAELNAGDIVITIGKVAFAEALNTQALASHPVLATMISSREYYRLLKQSRMANGARAGPVSALFSDPSPFYQLTLSSLLFEKPVTAFIYSEQEQRLLDPIRRHAQALKLPDPVFIPLDSRGINHTLKNRLMVKADLLLATPDPQLYNSKNAKSIIFTLLDRKQALIGYSSGWVKSGALATVYSSQREITENLQNVVRTITSNNGELPLATHPYIFKVKTNQNIAQMLGVSIGNDDETTARLRDAIQRQEVLRYAE